MNEQQTKETKQPSGLKLYAIIVAAIVTGAAAIGIGAEVISEIDAQPVRRQKMAQLNSEILQGREVHDDHRGLDASIRFAGVQAVPRVAGLSDPRYA